MTIVTLKKKAQHKTDKVSHNSKNGFALNGTSRNTSYIGQTSLSKKNKVPNFKNNRNVSLDLQTDTQTDIQGGEGCCQNNKEMIKRSVMNTRGMMSIKYRNTRRPYPFSVVQPDSNYPQNQDQSSYIEKIKNESTCYQTPDFFEFQNSTRDRRNTLKNCLNNKPYPPKINNYACFSKII
tara:strand:+ start:184 stop:720 length:537 start_codon:yes stop_codon:yes gene_type:complete